RQPLSLGLPLPSRSLAQLGQSWKSVRDRRISSPSGDERARLRSIQSASQARISRPTVPARALRRPPAAVCQAVPLPHPRPGRGGRAHLAARSPLFHHLLRRRRGEFPPRRSFICARHPRCALSSAGGAGGGGSAARRQLRGAKENPQALPRSVLPLRRRRGGATLQPAADRRGPDSGILTSLAVVRGSLAALRTRPDGSA